MSDDDVVHEVRRDRPADAGPRRSIASNGRRTVRRSNEQVIVTIWWRDIPAQVNGQSGSTRHRVVLSAKFQRAIDRAKRKARIATAQDDTAQWRRTSSRCDEDVIAAAVAEAERLEATYSKAYLGKLAFMGGVAADVRADDAVERARAQRHDGARR